MTGGIQEAVDSLPPEGGVVVVDPGTYTLQAAVSLRSGVRLTGSGAASVLRHDDAISANLTASATAAQDYVDVGVETLFLEGMDIIVRDNDTDMGNVVQRRIVSVDRVNFDNRLFLDAALGRDLDHQNNGLVANTFPVIRADGYTAGTAIVDVTIDTLYVDGNRSGVPIFFAIQQAGILFGKVSNSVVRDMVVVDSSYDGISDQGTDTLPRNNLIENNTVINCAGFGIHLGSNNRGTTVSGNSVSGSGNFGMFFCIGVQYATVINNVFADGLDHGIAGIGPLETDNLILGNVVTGNAGHGIEALDVGTNTIAGNYVAHNGGDGIHLERTTDFQLSGNTVFSNTGHGLSLTDAGAAVTNSILWGNSGDEIHIASGSPPTVAFSDVQGGYFGSGNIDADPLLVAGLGGDTRYLSQVDAGQGADSPCLDTGSGPAASICYSSPTGVNFCMDQWTTRSDHVAPDSGTVDMGYHAPLDALGTVTAQLTCVPDAGTLPFITELTLWLINNHPDQSRRIAGRINVELGNGASFSNWRSGYTNLGPGEMYFVYWDQPLGLLARLVGTNTFTFFAEDVTPPPYNQPPYDPAGDTATFVCTVECSAP